MKRIHASFLTGILCVIFSHIQGQQWTAQQANDWSSKHPWIVGCNFIPSTAINQLEMWQAETFDTTTINRELGYMEGIGMNTARVFLHYLVWQQDWPGFRGRMERYLQLADRHKIKTMFVLFDDCWNGSPKLGTQPNPIPGVHNSGWVQCPGDPAYKNTDQFPSYEKYTSDILTYFKNDSRILLWDLYNEAGNGYKGTQSWPLVKAAFQTAFQVRPSQPVSSCWWTDQGDMDDWELDNSDVITYHYYGSPSGNSDFVNSRLKPYGRPIICSEYMARPIGSTFQNQLAYFYNENIGAINWGLVDGKTQTKFPWGSPEGAPEPNPWFHEVFHPDGTSYDTAETNLIRLYSTLSKTSGQATVVPTSENTAQTWKYTVTSPASDWTTPNFDDATWSVGNGGFGNNGTTQWTSSDIWIRRTFDLGDISEEFLTSLFLRISFDEDAEVYFNGVLAAKVTRFSVGYVSFPILRAALLALKEGETNTLAVHCHQTAGGQFIDVGIQSIFDVATSLVSTSESNATTWTYTTSSPTGSWTSLAFNDQAWSSGQGGFGTSVPNVTPHSTWNTPDIWLRKKFTGPQDLPAQLWLRFYYDEDVEVYLNGTLILSKKGYVQTYQNILLGQTALSALITKGQNILAVHCKQTAGGQFVDVGLMIPSPPQRVKDNGIGLTGQYYNGTQFETPVLLRVDTTVKFDWGFGSPDSKVSIDHFSAKWSGYILPAISGEYTFYINSDNGRTLSVGSQVLIDAWLTDWGKDYSGKIVLQGGQTYPIAIEYYEEDGGANITFDWAHASILRQAVPAVNLLPDYTLKMGNGTVTAMETGSTVQDRLQAFPNPFSKQFAIVSEDGFTYTVSDMTGKLVETGAGNGTIEMGQKWSNGLFMLKVEKANGTTQWFKMVKN